MPRNLQPLIRLFSGQVDEAVKLVRAAEAIRAAIPASSHARKGFSFSQIEAMYELAYLRVFAAWEVFLEESFLRLMCGYRSRGISHPTRSLPGPIRIADARAIVLGSKSYKPWHDPTIVIQRTGIFFAAVPGIDVPHAAIVGSASVLIKDFSEIRHHIAHLTDDTCTKYHAATMRICGARFGRRAGRFLRSFDTSDPARPRWLDRISADLKHLAGQF